MNSVVRIFCMGIALAMMCNPKMGFASRVNTMDGTRVLPPPSKEEVLGGAKALSLPKGLKVPTEWIPLLNRAYEEYWREGNHQPDAGFVLFARNPTKETAKLWLLRMESKAKNLEELYALVTAAQQDLVKSGYMLDRYRMVDQGFKNVSAKANRSRDPRENSRLGSLDFYFLFSPTCPHCAGLAETLVGIPNVRPLQVTDGDLLDWPGLPPSDRATPETISQYVKDGNQPGGVPVLVIAERGSNQIVKLRGNRSMDEILAATESLKPHRIANWPYIGPVSLSHVKASKN